MVGLYEEDWEILHSYQLWRSKEVGKAVSMAEAVHHLLIHVAQSETERIKA